MPLHAVRMPKWGLSMREGTVTAWHVTPGQQVAAGDELCDIETAKITNALAAPEAGVLSRCLAPAGDVVPVGRLIAILAVGPASEAEIEALVQAESTHESRHAAGDAPDAAAAHRAPASVGTSRGRIAYVEQGEPGAPCVVLLHGFGGDHASWAPVQDVLARRRRVIAFDLPGHGGSTRDIGDASPAALATPLIEAMRALCPGPFQLAAHSYGAAVARALLALGMAPADTTLVAPVGLGAAVDAGYVRGFAAARRKRDLRPVMERLFARPERLGREAVTASLALLDDPDTRAALQRIAETIATAPPGTPDWPGAAPWRVLWGEEDRVVTLPPHLAAALGARLRVLPSCGHMALLEAPEAVAEHILARQAAPLID